MEQIENERRTDQRDDSIDKGSDTMSSGDERLTLNGHDSKEALGHERRGPVAAALCDGLASALESRLPGLEVGRSLNWCSFSLPGMTRFAYLKHQQRQGSVEVWFAGDHVSYRQEHSFDIRPREETRGGFGPTFRARFRIANAAQVQEAAELLAQVSCPASHAKSKRGRPPAADRLNPKGSDPQGESKGDMEDATA